MKLSELIGDLPHLPEAECAKLEDKNFFFPVSGVEFEERLPVLKRLCGQCVHRQQCGDYAIKKEITDGFWGGMTPRERERIIQINNKREDRRSEAVREVQELLDLGYSKEQAAAKLGIKVPSLERRLERAKEKGIL